MTPTNDRFQVTVDRIAAVVEDLRQLAIPANAVHSISVEHWHSGVAVVIHIEGSTASEVALVDQIAEHYGLPTADPESPNYGRGRHIGQSPVHVYCGRPE